MRHQARPLVNILPAEENAVLPDDGLDIVIGEIPADGATVLVEYHAAGLVEDLPAALPCHVAEVGVFQVERCQQLVESAKFEELRAVEGATSAAAVEAGEEVVDSIVDSVTHVQAAVLPPALGEAALLAEPVWVAEEDLAGDGEDFAVAEAFQQGRQEIGSHAHVAIQQDDDIVPGGAEAGVGATAEAQVLWQGENGD